MLSNLIFGLRFNCPPGSLRHKIAPSLSLLTGLTSIDISSPSPEDVEDILNINFINIKSISLHITSKYVLGSLSKYSASLESLLLSGPFEIPENSPNPISDLSLKNLLLNTNMRVDEKLRFIYSQSKTLESLEVSKLIGFIDPSAKIFFDGLSDFKHLKYLKFHFGFKKELSQSILSQALINTPQLEELEISIQPSISPNLFRSISQIGSRLRVLKLSHFELTNELISHLMSLSNLRCLCLNFSSKSLDLDMTLLKAFFSSLEFLVSLELSCRWIGDMSIKNIVFNNIDLISIINSCKNLDSVKLDGVFSSITLTQFVAECPFVSKIELLNSL